MILLLDPNIIRTIGSTIAHAGDSFADLFELHPRIDDQILFLQDNKSLKNL